MAADFPTVDEVLNKFKSNGTFDQFRKACLESIEAEVKTQHLIFCIAKILVFVNFSSQSSRHSELMENILKLLPEDIFRALNGEIVRQRTKFVVD